MQRRELRMVRGERKVRRNTQGSRYTSRISAFVSSHKNHWTPTRNKNANNACCGNPGFHGQLRHVPIIQQEQEIDMTKRGPNSGCVCHVPLMAALACRANACEGSQELLRLPGETCVEANAVEGENPIVRRRESSPVNQPETPGSLWLKAKQHPD